MNESQLEPYREEILAMKKRGMSTAAMQRQIEQTHRVSIKKTLFYDFVNKVTNGTAPEPEGELFMTPKGQPLYNPVDEETRAFNSTVLTNLDQVRQELANVIKWLSAMNQEAERQGQATREALQHFQQTLAEAMAVRQVEASRASLRPPETPRPAVNPTVTSAFKSARQSMPSFALPAPRSWKHALLYSGLMWGAVVMLFVYGYWRPLWAAVMGWAGIIAELPLHT